MKTKRIRIAVSVFLAACVSIWIGAAAPEWIQYYERVVGENSPYYTDVVNRPAKQIWGNFTSQHTADGGHKSSIFPTPIPFPTPSEGDNLFLVEHTITGTHLTSIFPTPIPTLPFPTPIPTVTPSAGDAYFLTEHSLTGIHTPFPTPIPTVTPSEGDLHFLAEHSPAGLHTPFPTPIPTVTPSLGDTLYMNWGTPHLYMASATIPIEECRGLPIVFGGDSNATLTLPSDSVLGSSAYYEIFLAVVTASPVTLTVNAGEGTAFVTPSSTAYTHLVTATSPRGYNLYLRYVPTWHLWVVLSLNGTWTPS